MTVLVTGGSGRVGACVVQGLIDAGIAVRALSRDPARARVPSQVELAAGDLTEPASLNEALDGVRSVFLYAQTENLAGQMRAMREAGVEQVVLLSTIDATNPHAYAQHNRRRHCAVEAAVAGAGFRHTFLRPGAFAGNALRFWGTAISAGGPVPMPFPESQQAPVDERDIAAVAVEAFTSDRLDAQALVLTGPESLTQRRQLELIAQTIGRPLDVRAETVEEARTRLAARIPSAYVELLLAQWADEVGMSAVVTDTVERVTGRRATDYVDWVRRNAAALVGAPRVVQ